MEKWSGREASRVTMAVVRHTTTATGDERDDVTWMATVPAISRPSAWPGSTARSASLARWAASRSPTRRHTRATLNSFVGEEDSSAAASSYACSARGSAFCEPQCTTPIVKRQRSARQWQARQRAIHRLRCHERQQQRSRHVPLPPPPLPLRTTTLRAAPSRRRHPLLPARHDTCQRRPLNGYRATDSARAR